MEEKVFKEEILKKKIKKAIRIRKSRRGKERVEKKRE